ncbi:2-dehydropantoate 2-reductase [Psychrobium sp. MM17-31]|uniref:ketopantoate reductase family protein n=1 Tax=Psychrobium sp. MM17-31 TaxID=2917758 RepID=UPI001EF6A813|nr:2-dehydropantoate 2-reductase [Psychrobium sp. MM17-31]MCG7530998.1 2-dehydropantoate 2-reductase [Psychrobium sp. MM17-31]
MPKPVSQHICIIGHGAIGLLWGHHLTAAGHQITFISRRQQLPASKQRISSYNGIESVNEFTFSHQLPQDCDLVLVTTKAYQVHGALAPFLADINVPIILLHNGMGAVEALPLTAHQQVMLATTTHGALIDENSLSHTGLGNTIIGNYQGLTDRQLEHWQQLLKSALPTVEIHHNIQLPLLLKLAINCVINPLTAIHQCKNGELLSPKFDSQIDKLIHEIQQVISQLEPNWHHDKASLKQAVLDVANATANNYSSMAQDVKYCRTTEIEFINGYILTQAKRLKISLPENENLIIRLANANK